MDLELGATTETTTAVRMHEAPCAPPALAKQFAWCAQDQAKRAHAASMAGAPTRRPVAKRRRSRIFDRLFVFSLFPRNGGTEAVSLKSCILTVRVFSTLTHQWRFLGKAAGNGHVRAAACRLQVYLEPAMEPPCSMAGQAGPMAFSSSALLTSDSDSSAAAEPSETRPLTSCSLPYLLPGSSAAAAAREEGQINQTKSNNCSWPVTRILRLKRWLAQEHRAAALAGEAEGGNPKSPTPVRASWGTYAECRGGGNKEETRSRGRRGGAGVPSTRVRLRAAERAGAALPWGSADRTLYSGLQQTSLSWRRWRLCFPEAAESGLSTDRRLRAQPQGERERCAASQGVAGTGD